MPIVLTKKIFRVQKNKEGPLCEVVYLVKGGDLADPEWSRDGGIARIFPWEQANDLARKWDAHAIVVGGSEAESAVARVPLPKKPAPEPKAAKRTRVPRQHWPMANLHRIRGYQSELERRKLS